MKILSTLKASWQSPEIRRRILITIFIIIIFRLLAAVPVPGIKPDALKDFFNSPAGGALQFLNTFAGGTLDQFSILSVGLVPFINASVIFQLLPTIIKRLENMQKEGEVGRKKLTQYTRLLTVPLAILTSITIFIALSSSQSGQAAVISVTDPLTIVSIISVLTAGALFMMWMGEVLTEKGIGNGISILIMVGILAAVPPRFIGLVSYFKWEDLVNMGIAIVLTILISCILLFILRSAKNFRKWYIQVPALMFSLILTTAVIICVIIPEQIAGFFSDERIKIFAAQFAKAKDTTPVELGMILGGAAIVIGFIVLFNEATKNLPIYFSRKATTAAVVAKKSFMPLKVLQAGVMPIIFASALLLFPYTLAIIFTRLNVPVEWIQQASNNVINFLNPPDWKYWVLNFLFTVFFAYFYTFVLFRPTQVAENLKKNGSYVPGVRPGVETEKFLTSTMLHLVFAGAVVLGLMSTSQAFVGGGLTGISDTSSNNSLLSTIFTSGTSLLITVGVVLDTRRQFRSYLAQKNYDDLFDDLDNLDNQKVSKKESKKKNIGK